MSEEAAHEAKQLFEQIEAAAVNPFELPLPENFTIALDPLQQVRQNEARAKLLRRKELALLKEREPDKVAEQEVKTDEQVGRALLDEQLAAEPTPMTRLVSWDWRVELLDPDRRRAVLRVFERVDPWRLCVRCRFKSGCSECDAWKALRYHLSKTGYVGPALWGEQAGRVSSVSG